MEGEGGSFDGSLRGVGYCHQELRWLDKLAVNAALKVDWFKAEFCRNLISVRLLPEWLMLSWRRGDVAAIV